MISVATRTFSVLGSAVGATNKQPEGSTTLARLSVVPLLAAHVTGWLPESIARLRSCDHPAIISQQRVSGSTSNVSVLRI